jgi:hypothetical protein
MNEIKKFDCVFGRMTADNWTNAVAGKLNELIDFVNDNTCDYAMCPMSEHHEWWGTKEPLQAKINRYEHRITELDGECLSLRVAMRDLLKAIREYEDRKRDNYRNEIETAEELLRKIG